MIQKSANVISNWLVNSGVIDSEERELYSYAAYSFLISISPLFMAFVFGVIIGQVVKSVVLIIPFVIIRKFSGGYHTKKSWSCMLGSSLLLCLCVYSANNIVYNRSLVIVTIISGISLMILSPIDSENRRLDLAEKRKYKRITIYAVGVFEVMSILLGAIGEDLLAVCISVGVVLTAGLQIPCVVQNIIGRVKSW